MAALLAIRPPYTMRGRWLAAYRDWRRGRRDLEPGQTPAQLALMTIQRIGRIGAIPTEVMDVRVRSPIGRKPSWWQVAGKTCVAAYQPKGAASLAASYVNLATPGTYDAAQGVAPTLTADGWAFNGSSQYLTTGVIPSSTSYTYLVRFSGVANTWRMFGFQNSSAAVLWIEPSIAAMHHYVHGGSFSDVLLTGAALTSGVMGIAGKAAYLNGSPDGTVAGAGFGGSAVEIFIGAINNGGGPGGYFSGNVQAFVAYSDTLTAGEVAVVSAAMAAL